MALKVLLGGEALATRVASEWPLASVGQHVALDIGRIVGRIAAQVACVLLLGCAACNGPRYSRVLLSATAAGTAAATPRHGYRPGRRWDCCRCQHHRQKTCRDFGEGGGKGSRGIGVWEERKPLLTLSSLSTPLKK